MEPTNAKRAAWAEAALEAFNAECGGDLGHDEDAHASAGDLIADLAHWCDKRGLNFAAVLGSAMTHYYAEICADGEEEGHACEVCRHAVDRMMRSIDWPESQARFVNRNKRDGDRPTERKTVRKAVKK